MPSGALPSGFVFSQASIQDYSDCPQRFQLRYIERLQWPALYAGSDHLREQEQGQHFHRLVHQQRIGIPPEHLSGQELSPDLERWWQNYRTYFQDPDGYTLYPEFTLSAAPGTDYRLLAKYDLLAIHPGVEARIYDWKTYARRPRDERMLARWQTRIYRLLLVEAGSLLNGGVPIQPGQVSMNYWYANHPTEPAHFPYQEAHYQRDREALIKIITAIASASDFPRTDDEKMCAACLYRSYCERSVTAGQEDFLETDLPEPEIDLEQVQEIVF